MNLTIEQRAQLQDRLARIRYQLVAHDATASPLPRQPLHDHEAVAFVEAEEHRLDIIAGTYHFTARALRAPVDEAMKSTAWRTIAPQRPAATIDSARPCRRFNRVCVVHQDYWPCRTHKEHAA